MAQVLNFAIKAKNDGEDALRKIQSQLDAVGKAAAGADKHAGAFGTALKNVGQIAGGFVLAQGILKAPGFLMDAAKAAAADEQATKRLEQALRLVGGAFEDNKRKVDARIESGQKLAFTDDQVRDSFQTLLAATGDVDEALRRQALAMDLARGAGIPLEKASLLLGKVTEENVQVFKRMGITLKEGSSEAEAFAAVQAKFGGQAKVYAESTAGQFEITKIQMGELKEQIGTALMPVMVGLAKFAVETLIPALQRFGDWFEVEAKPRIKDFVERVKLGFERMKTYYDENLLPIINGIRENWDAMWAVVKPLIDQFALVVETTFKLVRDSLELVMALLRGDWSRAWEEVKALVDTVVTYYKESLGNLAEFIRGLIPLVKAAAKELGSALAGAFMDALGAGLAGLWDLAAAAINPIIDAYNKSLGRIPTVANIPRFGESAAEVNPGDQITTPSKPFLPGLELPAYAHGTPWVPRTGLALLHRGEAVIPASQNRAGAGVTVNVYGNVYGVDDLVGEIERAYRRRIA